MAKTNLSSVIYAGIFLATEERTKLLSVVNPHFPAPYHANHVTLMFKPHDSYLFALKPMFSYHFDYFWGSRRPRPSAARTAADLVIVLAS